MMLSGCLSETIESTIDDGGVIAPEEYSWEDDGELVIVTYDVTGLTDELISEFENISGYEVELMKLDDAGSSIEPLTPIQRQPSRRFGNRFGQHLSSDCN